MKEGEVVNFYKQQEDQIILIDTVKQKLVEGKKFFPQRV
jgi:cell fate (sporulation/competence/biofilm development) regulator YmcA (YheA/YmcA/DUF963 family)